MSIRLVTALFITIIFICLFTINNMGMHFSNTTSLKNSELELKLTKLQVENNELKTAVELSKTLCK